MKRFWYLFFPKLNLKQLTLVFPFLGWAHELKSKSVLKADLVAGLTVALVLVPQSMAYAQLAGLPAQYGLYAACLPVLIGALMGSSRQLSTGPVAVVSLLTATALQPLATSPETYISYAFLLAFLVGVVQLSLGLLRLGVIVNFLSHPVVIGFTNAAAIIIAASQLSKVFGVAEPEALYTYQRVWGILVNAYEGVHLVTSGLAVLTFVLIFSTKRLFPKAPSMLVGVILVTLFSWGIDFGVPVSEGGYGGMIVGTIPVGLPAFVAPSFDFSVLSQLLITAFTIALVGFMEAISVAKVMASQTKQYLRINQELIGQGLANVTAGFFQGYAVSGSFSRSAINISAGAMTGFSSIVAAIVIAITLLWLTPLLFHLPQATLAVLIMIAVGNLIQFKPIVHAWRVEKHDAFVALTTFFVTLVSAPHLENGIIFGVALSLGLFLYRTMTPRFVELTSQDRASAASASEDHLESCEIVSIVKYSGSLYFANAAYFEGKILKHIADKQEHLRYIIVDAGSINQIDSSGAEMLSGLIERCSQNHVEILLARPGSIINVLRRSGFVEKHGEEHFFPRRHDALHYAWERLSLEGKDNGEEEKDSTISTIDPTKAKEPLNQGAQTRETLSESDEVASQDVKQMPLQKNSSMDANEANEQSNKYEQPSNEEEKDV